jgi:hypothetical protein
VQLPDEVLPAPAEDVPAGHAEHAAVPPPLEYVPVVQMVQAPAEYPPYPAVHTLHCPGAVLPVLLVLKPVEHELHAAVEPPAAY